MQVKTSRSIVLSKSGRYRFELVKEGIEVSIVGAFRASGHEVLEVEVVVVHRAPHTSAQTVLKGVVEDRAQLKLNGTIIVEPTAQQTNAFLRENILLLSPTARAEAIPNLEILANDVKCSHAATITNIPEEQLFYLMSRGLTRRKAEVVVVKGFLKTFAQR